MDVRTERGFQLRTGGSAKIDIGREVLITDRISPYRRHSRIVSAGASGIWGLVETLKELPSPGTQFNYNLTKICLWKDGAS
jgi:hypothetical protein